MRLGVVVLTAIACIASKPAEAATPKPAAAATQPAAAATQPAAGEGLARIIHPARIGSEAGR